MKSKRIYWIFPRTWKKKWLVLIFPFPSNWKRRRKKRTLYKQVPNRNLIPKENVYLGEKNIKGHNNPFMLSF